MRKRTLIQQALSDAERAALYFERRLILDPSALSTVSHADVQRVAAALDAARMALLTIGTAHPYTPNTEA